MTQLTAHFSLDELTRTEVRTASNACPAALLPDLLDTAAMLERVRAALAADCGRDVRIDVTSGYRSPAVNAAVGGSPHSDHLMGLAADFRAPDYGTPYQVATFLATRTEALGIGQVIHEFGRWAHVSRKAPDRAVNRAITISAAGTVAGIVEVA
jgi:zinc D-Ala-D-Ala carboxypeptidase